MVYKQIAATDPIRICFLGCGEITKDHAAYAKIAENNIQLSFASRSLEKATQFVDQFKGVNAYASYKEAIDSELEDVIMINTPPHIHLELAKQAIHAGKHVIIEKPPFFASSDFDEVGPLADHKGLHCMIAENYFYKPLRLQIKKLLDQELIGDPLFMNINATKKQISAGDWRDDPKITGFGSLYEGGIHWVNFINNLGFDLKNVTGFFPNQKQSLERSSQVTVKTTSGFIINLLYSWEADTIFRGYRLSKIFGREGSITFETNGLFILVRGKKKKLIFPGIKDIGGYQGMFNDFMKSLRSGIAPELNWKIAQKDLQVIEEAYQNLDA